jgi:hypothetical protein
VDGKSQFAEDELLSVVMCKVFLLNPPYLTSGLYLHPYDSNCRTDKSKNTAGNCCVALLQVSLLCQV